MQDFEQQRNITAGAGAQQGYAQHQCAIIQLLRHALAPCPSGGSRLISAQLHAGSKEQHFSDCMRDISCRSSGNSLQCKASQKPALLQQSLRDNCRQHPVRLPRNSLITSQSTDRGLPPAPDRSTTDQQRSHAPLLLRCAAIQLSSSRWSSLGRRLRQPICHASTQTRLSQVPQRSQLTGLPLCNSTR